MKFKKLLDNGKHLALVGIVSPIEALFLKNLGFKAAYLSGAGLSLDGGFLDEGLISLEKTLQVVGDIRKVSDLLLLVDCDTGLCMKDSELSFDRLETQKEAAHLMTHLLQDAGADGVQIEDQVPVKKRCGHLPGKELISVNDMFWKVRMIAQQRKSKDLLVVARTDARAVEGLDGAIFRAERYLTAGADAIFPEALESLEEFQAFRDSLPNIPLVANLTTHGKTPETISADQLFEIGYQMVLFPVPLRILLRKYVEILKEIKQHGSMREFVVEGDILSRDYLNELITTHSKVYLPRSKAGKK